ncbi:MAG: hypothetical protein ACLFVO_06830 [Chloroflexaceae bacterium]
MKSIRYKLRALCNEHVLFFSYRWAAWAVAALVVFLHSRSTPDVLVTPGMLLLVLTLVVNFFLTAFSLTYLRVIRRRPTLLALDVVASVALIWVVGGMALPFLPYALGALILPALLLGWRSALLLSLLFVAVDLALLSVQTSIPQGAGLTDTAVRATIPPAFALIWSGIPWLARRIMLLPLMTPARHAGRLFAAEQEDLASSDMNASQPVLPVPKQTERSMQQLTAGLSVASQRTPVRTTMEPGIEQSKPESWRTTFVLQPHPDVDLSIALNHLITTFRNQHLIDVHLVQAGAPRQLTPVQYGTLFRLVQEALLNVQQHARTSSARLMLRYEADAVILTVQDDGVGLLDGTYHRPGIHALRAMYYRLAELDGHLEVFEGENSGVTVRGTLPLEEF